MDKQERSEFWVMAWSAISTVALLAFIFLAGSSSTEDVPVEDRPVKVVYNVGEWKLVKIL